MGNHANLTNDLHYAKVRTFADVPNEVTPDFIDEILVGADNQAYRAIGTYEGAVLPLMANPAQGTTIKGLGYPEFVPSAVGVQYFDMDTGKGFLSTGISSSRDWHLITYPIDGLLQLQKNANEDSNDFLKLHVFHTKAESAIVGQGFAFGEAITSIDYPFTQTSIGISNVIRMNGLGTYGFGVEFSAGYTGVNAVSVLATGSGHTLASSPLTGLVAGNGINLISWLKPWDSYYQVADNSPFYIDLAWG
jgi:hypothetical protein